jgi:UDP-N-acetylglucosamine--N-acetylmuramyl-(pentapeptide) pyrophosphoryl-undecaprenol N-acetylglucosamine transferase
MESKKIIKEFNPDVVIGTGGFASGPLLWQHDGYSYRNQEQNSYPGLRINY